MSGRGHVYKTEVVSRRGTTGKIRVAVSPRIVMTIRVAGLPRSAMTCQKSVFYRPGSKFSNHLTHILFRDLLKIYKLHEEQENTLKHESNSLMVNYIGQLDRF